MSQKNLKKARKAKKNYDQVVKSAMYAYCLDYCKRNNVKYEDLDILQKIALVRHSQGFVENVIKRTTV